MSFSTLFSGSYLSTALFLTVSFSLFHPAANAQNRKKTPNFQVTVIDLNEDHIYHEARTMNDRGEILFMKYTSPHDPVAFDEEFIIYSRGRVRRKGVCDSDHTQSVDYEPLPHQFTRRGQIPCSSWRATDPDFIDDRKGKIDIPPPADLGHDTARISRLNDRGSTLIWYTTSGAAPSRALYLWSNRKGGLQQVDTIDPAAPPVTVRAFNNRSQFVAHTTTEPRENRELFLHDIRRKKTKKIDHDLNGAVYLVDFNDRGQALLRSSSGFPLTWVESGIYHTRKKRFSPLTPPKAWEYLYPTHMNNRGTIVGYGSRAGREFLFLRDKQGGYHLLKGLITDLPAELSKPECEIDNAHINSFNNKGQLLLSLSCGSGDPFPTTVVLSSRRFK